MRKLMLATAPLLMIASGDLRSDSSLFDSYIVQESSKYAIGAEYLYFDQSLDLFDFSDEFNGAKPVGAEAVK